MIKDDYIVATKISKEDAELLMSMSIPFEIEDGDITLPDNKSDKDDAGNKNDTFDDDSDDQRRRH